MAAGVHGDAVIPTVITSEAAIKGTAGFVHWITISNTHATEAALVELNDSTADSGTDRWAVVVEAIDFKLLPFHAEFDPPIKFKTGIFCDITNGAVKVVVGHT